MMMMTQYDKYLDLLTGQWPFCVIMSVSVDDQLQLEYLMWEHCHQRSLTRPTLSGTLSPVMLMTLQLLFSSKYIQVLFVQPVTAWSEPHVCLFSFNGNSVEEKSHESLNINILYYNTENFSLRGPLNGQICKW